MTDIRPYIMVKNAKKAIEYYTEVFGAELVIHSPYEPGMGLPDGFDYENSTMHSEIKIGEARMYLADDANNASNDKGRVDVMLEPENETVMKVYYDKAVELGAEVVMEYQKTFWGAYFTRFIDPHGVGWQMNFQVEEA